MYVCMQIHVGMRVGVCVILWVAFADYNSSFNRKKGWNRFWYSTWQKIVYSQHFYYSTREYYENNHDDNVLELHLTVDFMLNWNGTMIDK